MINPNAKLKEWLAEQLQRVSDMSSIPVNIDAESEFVRIRVLITNRISEISAYSTGLIEEARNKVVSFTDELIQVRVTDLVPYRNGAPVTVKPTEDEANKAKSTPDSVSRHINGLKLHGQAILDSAKSATRDMSVALFFGLLLFSIGVFGVVLPLMQQAMGTDKAASDLGWLVWVTIGCSAISLIAGSASITFMQGREQRLKPWIALIVGIALIFILGRYIGVNMVQDFELFDSLSPGWQMFIRLLSNVGAAIALFCVEFAAGRCFAYAWMRFSQKGDLPVVESLLKKVEAWHVARIELKQAETSQAQVFSIDALVKTSVQMVADQVDRGLQPHREIVGAIDNHHSVGFNGSDLESKDIEFLRSQIQLCEEARDELLRLGGLSPPSGSSPAPKPPTTPPAPSPVTVNP